MYGTIRVDLPATRDKGYFTGVQGVGRSSVGKILPRVFLERKKNFPPIVGALSTFPLKKAGLGL